MKYKSLLTKAIMTALLLIFAYFYKTYENSNLLVVKFYDVGQGDAIFIKAPTGEKMLIDGGPDSSAITSLLRDLPPGPCYLDFVLLTHPDADHLSGLIEVLKVCDVEVLLTTGVTSETKTFERWKEEIAFSFKDSSLSELRSIYAGDSFSLGLVSISVLSPKKADITTTNSSSIIVLASYKDFDVLLTGDSDAKAFEDFELSSDLEIFKVSHHGSKYSFNKEFFDTVRPSISVISVGATNRYEHPAKEVVEALNKYSIIYRTDLNGTITIKSDGSNFNINKSSLFL